MTNISISSVQNKYRYEFLRVFFYDLKYLNFREIYVCLFLSGFVEAATDFRPLYFWSEMKSALDVI